MTTENEPQLRLDVLTERADEAELVLRITGSISHDTSIGLLQEFLAIWDQLGRSTMTLDMSEVTLIDSQGIGVICSLHHELEKRAAKLRLRNLNPIQRRVISIMRLDQLLEID